MIEQVTDGKKLRYGTRRPTGQPQQSWTHHEAPMWGSCMCTVAAGAAQSLALDLDHGRYQADGSCRWYKSVTDGSKVVDPRDPTLRVPLRCLPAGAVARLLGGHTPCYPGSVPGKEVMNASNRNVEKRYTLSTAESRL